MDTLFVCARSAYNEVYDIVAKDTIIVLALLLGAFVIAIPASAVVIWLYKRAILGHMKKVFAKDDLTLKNILHSPALLQSEFNTCHPKTQNFLDEMRRRSKYFFRTHLVSAFAYAATLAFLFTLYLTLRYGAALDFTDFLTKYTLYFILILCVCLLVFLLPLRNRKFRRFLLFIYVLPLSAISISYTGMGTDLVKIEVPQGIDTGWPGVESGYFY